MKESEHKRIHQPAIARLHDVTVTYDDYFTRALANVSLEVRQGEVFALLGPVGSGKSTALKVLAGRLRPVEGKATVFGRSPRRGGTKARIGFLSQNTDEKNSVGFTRLLKTFFAHIRGGTRPPRNILQMLARNPELIILDEPFSGLNEEGCCEMKDLIARLAAQGKTVIISDKSLHNVKNLCHRVAICHGGKIEATGTLDEILARPDLIRSVSPLLSPAMAGRVLEVIRMELTNDVISSENGRNGDIPDRTQPVRRLGRQPLPRQWMNCSHRLQKRRFHRRCLNHLPHPLTV